MKYDRIKLFTLGNRILIYYINVVKVTDSSCPKIPNRTKVKGFVSIATLFLVKQ